MEGLPMVSYLTGTMNSLVDKLAKMKIHSNSTKEFSEFEKAVLSLKEDFFDKHAVPEVCMKQVRELVFEIEDWIDQKKLETEDIKKFMTEIKEARERFIWYYDLLKINININRRRLLVEEKPCHGLFDGPRDELVKHLTDEKEEMLKVVSIVGREGIGKTTLAKEIYSELQLRGQFECQAFVSVGQRRPMREILNDILRQVKPGSEDLLEVPGVTKLTTELREHLDKKRYFILVDGIWSTLAWKVITCALPNNYGSRVMTTTCIIDVANSCSRYPNDLVYQMEELNRDNSRTLFKFLSKTITIEEEEKWAGFEEDSCYLLKMCGGLPLAIIVAAGLLLARNSEALAELIMLWESIYTTLNQYSSSDGMTKILHMSFAGLSLPARSCFMYLSVFREYETIMKDRLIRLWGAEGFIPKRDKECWLVTGEKYFNELISRRLIQPVFTCDDDQAVGCTVHTVILDFIRSISRKENFATRATELNSGPFPCDTIRRFSLDCGMEDEAVPLSTSSLHLSSMRSLIVFGDVKGKLSDPPGLPSVSKQGEEMHATEAPEYLMRRQRSRRQSRMRPRRVLKDVEGKPDPPDSPAADERISDPEGLPSDSKQGEEMHATEAPGVGIMDQPSRRPRVFGEHVEGKHDPPDSRAADERVSDPQGLPSDSKQGEEMEAPRVPTKILSAFKLLRVLDLQDTKNLKNHHLEGIGELVLLRYLGLAGTGITQLPEQIGELEQLETLDLRRNIWLTTFPASIVKLQKVRHLLLQGYTKEIWEMPELEEASGIRVDRSSMPELEEASGIRVDRSSSLGTVTELLKKSEQLRMLGLFLKEKPTKADLDLFLEEVVKSKLQSISIGFGCSSLYDVIPVLLKSWESVTAPPAQEFEPQRFVTAPPAKEFEPQRFVTAPPAKEFEPQRFELRITWTNDGGLVQVPGNMGSLASLTHLHIGFGQAKAEDFLVLGGLTNLVLLSLVAEECLQGENITIKGGIFPCLKVFSFRIKNTWMGLEFEEGAMPQLQRFKHAFRVSARMNEAYPDTGIEHLTCLLRIHATLNCQDVTVAQVMAAEAAIRGEISKIATKPTLELSRERMKLA